MAALSQLLASLLILLSFIALGLAIQCYQCDSNEDASCPSSRRFDKHLNALVDCNSLEAHTPGTFCMKIQQQSPGWRGWKKVTRRCGSRSDTGVAWGCRWIYEDNGVWKETCYCEDRDGCNGASSARISIFTVAITTVAAFVIHLLS